MRYCQRSKSPALAASEAYTSSAAIPDNWPGYNGLTLHVPGQLTCHSISRHVYEMAHGIPSPQPEDGENHPITRRGSSSIVWCS